MIRAQCSKKITSLFLRMFEISSSVCASQAFSIQSNVSGVRPEVYTKVDNLKVASHG
jgi:hypothetical protein